VVSSCITCYHEVRVRRSTEDCDEICGWLWCPIPSIPLAMAHLRTRRRLPLLLLRLLRIKVTIPRLPEPEQAPACWPVAGCQLCCDMGDAKFAICRCQWAPDSMPRWRPPQRGSVTQMTLRLQRC
jgi:hypothetical protein